MADDNLANIRDACLGFFVFFCFLMHFGDFNFELSETWGASLQMSWLDNVEGKEMKIKWVGVERRKY